MTSINFHNVQIIRADTTGTKGAPLSIYATDRDGHCLEAVLFTGDFVLNTRLIDAINSTVAAHEAEKSAEAAQSAA